MGLIGRTVSVDDVLRDALQDRAFYEASGGGVTLSGGEPVLQTEFARALLAACQQAGVHTAVETAGNYPWHMLVMLLPFTDLVMMDLKQMDPAKHRKATGASNERIFDNARCLAQTDKLIVFRIPVIPTVNDQPGEVRATALFVRTLMESRATGSSDRPAGPISLELLTFHKLAGDKYRSLDLDNCAADLQPLPKAAMHALVDVAGARGVPVQCR